MFILLLSNRPTTRARQYNSWNIVTQTIKMCTVVWEKSLSNNIRLFEKLYHWEALNVYHVSAQIKANFQEELKVFFKTCLFFCSVTINLYCYYWEEEKEEKSTKQFLKIPNVTYSWRRPQKLFIETLLITCSIKLREVTRIWGYKRLL